MAAQPPVVHLATPRQHAPLASTDSLSLTLKQIGSEGAGPPTGATPVVPPFYVDISKTPAVLYIHDGTAWLETGSQYQGVNVFISDIAPVEPQCRPKDLWFQSSSGKLFVFYDDGNTRQWVQVGGDALAGGGVASSVVISDTPPGSPVPGSFWWESDSGVLFLRYADPNSSQWVQVSFGNPTPQAPSLDAYTKTESDARYVDVAGDTMTGNLSLPNLTASGSVSGTFGNFQKAAAGYALQGVNTVNVTGNGGVLGQVGPVYGICGYNASGTNYSFYGSHGIYVNGNIQGATLIAASGVQITGSISWTNIANYLIGYSGGANISTGTGQFDLLFSGGSKYMWTPTWCGPSQDNSLYLGVSSNRWYQVYAVTGTIQTSDEREKQDIRPLSDKEKAAAVRIKGLITTYRWKDRVASGQDARTYVGVIAQRIEEALAAEGLDAASYAMWTKDPIEEWVPAVVDADGNQIAEGAMKPTGEYRYSVDYSQVLAFIIGGM